jgi:uncharacterized protein YbjT (DUF2867 family)
MLLLTGATGYVGGRLLRRLEREGIAVRCLCRHPEALSGRVAATSEIVFADLLQPASLDSAFCGVKTAVYLVHSMHGGRQFESRERTCARNFVEAASKAAVGRIIYLGGLANDGRLSPHMRSRGETGDILRSSGIPVIEFRASIIIGSGSASFELIGALVDRLPIMVTPRWVRTAAQPIAIEDVIEYLIQAVSYPARGSLIVEIGGKDVTSYLGIMREYARQRNLRRWFISIPFLTPGLSSRWLTLVTPVYASIGRCLIESVRTPSIVQTPDSSRSFAVRPMGIFRAIERALMNEDHSRAETRWSDAGWCAPGIVFDTDRDVLSNEKVIRLELPPQQAFAAIRKIGGSNGWYFGNWLWRVRGFVDLMIGGVGMRRGRSDPETPLPGSTLDFWRVQIYKPNRQLRLLAEMKIPGKAWLEFRAEPDGNATMIRQVAYFKPHGIGGLLYWYLLWPVHDLMFRGMLRNIGSAALQTNMRVNSMTRSREELG